MSHTMLSHEVRIDSETLINLFLGHGNLPITEDGQTIILNGISRQISSGEGDEEFHIIMVEGISDNPDVTNVDGTGMLKPIVGSQGFILTLDLHIQDRFE